MNVVLIILLTLILSLVELFILPVPLAFLFLLLWAQFASVREAVVGAFLGGLLFDIVLLAPFGLTSMVFLGILFLLFLYRRKFRSANMLFLTVSSFASFLVLELFSKGSTNVVLVLAYTVATLILARIFFPQEKQYERW